MGLVLDSGALIAIDRGDRRVAALVEAARQRGVRVVTSAGCVGQTWRGGPQQALLARILAGIEERPLGPESSRAVGELCGRARLDDVVDAHLASLARTGDVVVTSDPADLRRLLRARDVHAEIVRC